MDIKSAVSLTTPATTTAGKTATIGMVSVGSVLVLAIASAIIGNPQLFSWKSGILVTLANMIVVFLPNLLSKNVPNT